MKRKHLPFYWWWPFIMIVSAVFIMPLCSCQKNNNISEENGTTTKIAVFVPGLLTGSPTYKMMNDGVLSAAAESENVEVKTVEAGFNQGEWESLLMELADEKRYDLIITSNPAMPTLCRNVGKYYPEQKFLCLEAPGKEGDTLSSFFFKHNELSFILGYFAGLITSSDLPGANKEARIGLLAGQEYTEMTTLIKPGFLDGALKANSSISLDYRVLGNWYDAEKAAEITRSMISDGCDVILAVAGGGNQGILSAAKEAGVYVLWYDTNGYELEPGTVLGSGLIKEDKAAYELTRKFINGELRPGSSESVGIKEGYIDFITEDSHYIENVPEEIRKIQQDLISKIKNGDLNLDTQIESPAGK